MKTKNKILVLDKVVEFDHFKYMRTIIVKNMTQTKQCRSCGRVLPLTEYGINRANNDGYQIYCKECTNTKRREYRDSVRRRERLRMYKRKIAR